MIKTVITAVILAAGLGRRLKELGHNAPKGFLKFGEKPIIEESIEKLLESGITQIILVTGFLSEFYEDFASKYPEVKIVKNERYATSGSMYSLFCARALINKDFLLVESDLIYERLALETLLQSVKENCLLVCGETEFGDEVHVEVLNGCVSKISKKREEVKNVYGEFIGISKISFPMYQVMLRECEKLFQKDLNIEYDTGCISALANQVKVGAEKVEDLLWSEIDNKEQWQRVQKIIYPAIQSKDGQAQVDLRKKC